jgi:putative ABC transport system substrate-binding protein
VTTSGRRQFLQGGLILAGIGLLTGCGVIAPQAPPPPKTPRVGLLFAASDIARPALQEGLQELGYVEGQTILVESRVAEGRAELLPDFAAELARLPVDLIVTIGTAATLAARQATGTIPIVQALGASDLVREGVVASLAHPGGNVTGLTELAPELSAKRLQLLKEAVPGLRRAAVLWNPASPAAAQAVGETHTAAQTLGLQLQSLEVRTSEELESLAEAATREQAEALVVLTDPLTVTRQARIGALATAARLPAIFDRRGFAVGGGLLSYGPDTSYLYRRAASYVDKILKGTSPADLPIEQPTKFDFVINLKTARALGLTIPQSILMQATEVIQ